MVLEQVLDIIFVILKMYHKYTLKTFETPSLLLLSQKFYQSGILGADLQQRYVGEDNVYSIHNFSLNIIMDYGIIALIMLTIYIFTLFKFLRFSDSYISLIIRN